MFNLNNVTLRPLETSDIETLYAWDDDIEVNVLGGWVRQQSARRSPDCGSDASPNQRPTWTGSASNMRASWRAISSSH